MNATSTDLHLPRWLVVDDDPALLQLTVLLLSKLTAAEVCGYTDPRTALAAADAGPKPFDLLVTDFDMPGMNGEELTRQLHRRAPELPVILMSGRFVELSPDEFHAMGFVAFVPKPFHFEALADVIGEVLHAAYKPCTLDADDKISGLDLLARSH